MTEFFFISFLFLSIVLGLPVFWQIKQPVQDGSLMFMWKAVNLLLLIGFLITFIRASWLTLFIFAVLILSIGAKKKVAGGKKAEPAAEPIRAEVHE